MNAVPYQLQANIHNYGDTLSDVEQNQAVIHQNLFWAESCPFAIHVLADTAIYHGSETHPQDNTQAISNIAEIGKMLVKHSYLQLSDFEENIRREHDLEA